MLVLKLFLTFFKIGLFTFGGGYAMLPLIQSEVLSAGWMNQNQLVNFVAVSESTPGPFAINISTYVGIETAGILGALAATLGVVMPSFIIILIVAHCYEKFKTNNVIKGVMTGLRPAVVGLILGAVISIGKTVFFEAGLDMSVLTTLKFWISMALFAFSTVLVFKKKHPIIVILLAAVVGIAAGYIFDIPV